MDYFKQTLKTDCEDLLARFQATASVRFEEFSAIWREMKFSSIFYGILEPSEKKVFTRLVLSAASQYLLPPYSFQIRVGGLYLLYSLYTSQFNVPKERIRIALKDWDELIRFQQDAVNAQHYDVVYILKKLLSEQAVCFTAMPDTLSFQVKKKRVDRRQQLCESFVDRPTRPQELIGTDLLEELANVHEHYEGLKKAILPRPPQSNLSLVKPNLVPKLRSAVLTFCSWQQNQAEFGSPSDGDAGEGTSSQAHDESSRRAQLLASIKSRSYAQAVEASRSRRHRQIELTSAAQDSESTRQIPRFRKPPSLKMRTSSRFTAEGSENGGLQRTTRLWRLTAVEGEKTEEKKKRRFIWKERMRSEH
ncbi:snRNA-activating protein complex subunit 1b [Ictalurus punctatus]|uniref:snRNA-activating protein complex subunit 1b n=1 Tax=Ictalurus punctatus TaxID=7998 RepID=A0A979EHA7_ICTPU|nr:snRNA-activating protein complex subunit 1b [Ictalurus punctatus]